MANKGVITKNISNGMIVENYPKMCELLEEESKNGGKSKVLQVERWKRYIDFEPMGHKYLIKNIREIPLPKPFSKNDKYSEDILTILLYYLHEKKSSLNLTTKQILILCGFVNKNYVDISSSLKLFVNDGLCPLNQAKYFFNALYMNVKSYAVGYINNSLKRLCDRHYLELKDAYIIKYTNEKTPKFSSEEQKRLIKIAETKVRDELKINTTNIYNEQLYYKRINELLFDQGFSVLSSIRCISLGENAKSLSVTKDDRDLAVKRINEQFTNKMIQLTNSDMSKYICKNISNYNIEIDKELTKIFELLDLELHDKRINKSKMKEHFDYVRDIKFNLLDFFIPINKDKKIYYDDTQFNKLIKSL